MTDHNNFDAETTAEFADAELDPAFEGEEAQEEETESTVDENLPAGFQSSDLALSPTRIKTAVKRDPKRYAHLADTDPKKGVPVHIAYRYGTNLEEAVEIYGEAAVFGSYVTAAKLKVGEAVRGFIEAGIDNGDGTFRLPTTEEVQAFLDNEFRITAGTRRTTKKAKPFDPEAYLTEEGLSEDELEARRAKLMQILGL